MCLSKVTATTPQPHGLIVDGWKSFGGTSQVPTFMMQPGTVKLDEWMQASGPDIKATDGKTYKAGFHVYVNEDAHASPKGRRVYVRRVTSEGDQDGMRCLIAQEMYVPSNRDGWPPVTAAAAPAPAPVAKKSVIDRLRAKRGDKP